MLLVVQDALNQNQLDNYFIIFLKAYFRVSYEFTGEKTSKILISNDLSK